MVQSASFALRRGYIYNCREIVSLLFHDYFSTLENWGKRVETRIHEISFAKVFELVKFVYNRSMKVSPSTRNLYGQVLNYKSVP